MSLIVKPIPGEHLRFYVVSQSEKDADHIADLGANNGNGECSCRFYEVTCGYNWRNNGKKCVPYYRDEKGKVGKDVTMCKHLNAARHYLLDSILPGMAQEEKKGTRPVMVKNNTEDGFPF